LFLIAANNACLGSLLNGAFFFEPWDWMAANSAVLGLSTLFSSAIFFDVLRVRRFED
jgi:hypothetical protein